MPSTLVDFEAITYANVGGTWYGYFVANYPLQNESQIKRVPLTGGAAVVLATSPAVIDNRDLVTDGSSLYWADADGIRKMAITGGTVQTLVSGQTFAHLGLDGPVLYYSSGNSILTVPTSGGASTTVVSAPSPITAIYPPSTANGLLWGEANGSVNSFDGAIFITSCRLRSPVSASPACRTQAVSFSGPSASPNGARSMENFRQRRVRGHVRQSGGRPG